MRRGAVILVTAARTICLWMFARRAKQGMLPLLAHEVRPCLLYGVAFPRVRARAPSL